MGIYDKYFNNFPPEIQNSSDEDWAELGDILDGIDANFLTFLKELGNFWDADKSPENILQYLSYPVRAGVAPGDAVNVKRNKVYSGVRRHKSKGTTDNIFELIKEVTGVMPKIPYYSYFMIWESLSEPMLSPYDFMKWDSYNDLDGFGMGWISFTDAGPASLLGIIMIDLGIEGLQQTRIDKIVDILDYAGATYFRYILGHQTVDGWYFYRQVN